MVMIMVVINTIKGTNALQILVMINIPNMIVR